LPTSIPSSPTRSNGSASSRDNKIRLHTFLAAPLALLLTAAAPAPQSQEAAAQRIQADVEFLASDLLEGRDTGTRGHELAAAYVASQFRAIGLRPGAAGASWYQQVPFRRASHAAPASATFTMSGRVAELLDGRDFGIRPSLTQEQRSLDAGLVFAGYGISDGRLGIDDYAGIDPRGKIVVVLGGIVPSLPTDVAAHLRSMREETAARKGAVGLIVLEATADSAGRSHRPRQFSERAVLNWEAPDRPAGAPERIGAEIALSAEWGNRLFEGAAKPLEEVRADAAAGRPVKGFELPARLSIRSQSQWQEFTSPNVVGILPGSDPALGNEYVTLTAHLDHHGIVADAKPGEDAINNGAIDNASGVATMLEAARSFVASGVRPRRSIMFVAFTGEEHGLLGADYFASDPVAPIEQLAALVNLDMPMLLYDFIDVIAFGAEHSTVERSVAAAASQMGVALSPDPMPEQALFVRSDHYPFVKRGVPSVFLMTGHANGGEAKWKEFFATTYHRPNDDLSQPIHWRAGARFAEINYRIARALADADERPSWYEGSYFGNAFAPQQKRAIGE
jgi:Zn-dependent M28 family amino/carboxypeptidase